MGDSQPMRRVTKVSADFDALLSNLLVGVVGSFAQQGIPIPMLKQIVRDTIQSPDFWRAMADSAEDPESVTP